MKIIIAGSRNFNDYSFLKKEVVNIFKIIHHIYPNITRKDIEIISGNANGTDKMGEKFANENGLKLKLFPANWRVLGVGAGYIRNIEMAEYVRDNGGGVLIAFIKNNSNGTRHMINIAKKNSLKVYEINVDEDKNDRNKIRG